MVPKPDGTLGAHNWSILYHKEEILILSLKLFKTRPIIFAYLIFLCKLHNSCTSSNHHDYLDNIRLLPIGHILGSYFHNHLDMQNLKR